MVMGKRKRGADVTQEVRSGEPQERSGKRTVRDQAHEEAPTAADRKRRRVQTEPPLEPPYAQSRYLSRRKAAFVDNWLTESDWSRKSLKDEAQVREVLNNMLRQSATGLPSPQDSPAGLLTCRKSEASAASVRDSNYRESLRYRNIYITGSDAPEELEQKAQRVLLRSRTSPEIDDMTAKELIRTAKELQAKAEEDIKAELARRLIPAMERVPDSRLRRVSEQIWTTAYPIPLDNSILHEPLPLPRPKPDVAFGYPETAFTKDQQATIGLLTDNQLGRSFSSPHRDFRFPFLTVELKSQANGGTNYIAMNQVAGAGAIAIQGQMELMKRGYGSAEMNSDEPQFFSVSMDHEIARVNIHWTGTSKEDSATEFYVTTISSHLLSDANSIRAVIRSIKNILDYGADIRLRTLCAALDAYREKVLLEKATAKENEQDLEQAASNDGDAQQNAAKPSQPQIAVDNGLELPLSHEQPKPQASGRAAAPNGPRRSGRRR